MCMCFLLGLEPAQKSRGFAHPPVYFLRKIKQWTALSILGRPFHRERFKQLDSLFKLQQIGRHEFYFQLV